MSMSRVLIVFLVAGISAFGQISFPGSGGIGFPGQRRPRQNNPNDPNGPYDPNQQGGGQRGRGRQQNQQPETIEGTIRSNAGSEMVLESDDHLNTTVMLSGVTKFIRLDGSNGKRADFNQGDRVSIDGTVDDKANFKALKVKLLKIGPPTATTSIGALPPDDDSDRPKLRRAPSAETPVPAVETPTAVAPQIVRGDPSVNDDSDRPILRRGGPVARKPSEADDIIEKARAAALEFSETLPSYVVKQYTTRYATEMAKGGKTSWNALDNITADVVAEDGKETYKNIMVNGKKPKEDPEKTGAWSSGEFSSMLLDVLSPVTDADFHGKRTSTIGTRSAWRYDYSVEQPNSHWHIQASAQSYIPAYTGSIWIDKETFRVLRIEMSAKTMPKSFELDTVESAVDYDNVMIGDRKFMVPVHSEVMNCQRGTSSCSRNVIEFRNYRKFGADTSISFEPNQ